jgi:alpha-D-xyloside xylohydrolase
VVGVELVLDAPQERERTRVDRAPSVDRRRRGVPDDRRAWSCEDQYMFGPELLVCPVTSHGARSRRVYLPAGTRWRDVWTGTVHDGGTELDTAAPLERIPVFTPEGSTMTERMFG